MDIKEIERLSKKLCAYLRNCTWPELKELNVNGQQASRIKRGEQVRFYPKTIERLRHLVEKKA